jgi:hypothetical protein
LGEKKAKQVKKNILFGVVMAGLVLSTVSSRADMSLNFASTSTIQFNGTNSSFQFNSDSFGYQWKIVGEDGGTGSAQGLYGKFLNGPFSYGSISSLSYPGLVYQYASVTGPLAQMVIDDGLGYSLTGLVNWVQVSTLNAGGFLNDSGSLVVNVTGLSYLGSNADLQAFVGETLGSMTLSFQFSPGKTLSQLTCGNGPYATSFSGSVSTGASSTVPEPKMISFFVSGLCLLVCSWRLKRSQTV